jgi:hypothetical protein
MFKCVLIQTFGLDIEQKINDIKSNDQIDFEE